LLSSIAKKIFGTKNTRVLKALRPIVAQIGTLEPTYMRMSDAELRAQTAAFKLRVEKGQKLDELLPEAFAVCREAGRRAVAMRHFDVQLIGGMVLHRGGIAEMKTGEGKTLVATLPLYLNALSGKGVHLVTVNDYLARRDAVWMGRIYNFLGLSVGVIVHGKDDLERQREYRCDITYGTNSEFGFDYLRDNMKESIERYVQRDPNFAIVDEVDSILIDEARTPLIISGSAEEAAGLYDKVNGIIPTLRKDIDYTVDEKAHSSILTDSGVDRVERRLAVGNLYNRENIVWLHHVTQALRAHTLYKRDVNYVVENGEVVIVDEFTGRKMPGRRWSDGLHQAVEAKEGVKIQEENQTLATISYQNYFRLYKKLAGMTGTADTEAEEFNKIYKLEVTVIPTNRPMIRGDHHDLVYKNERGKFRAVLAEIEDCHTRGQPVLVGTVSVEKSQVVSSLLVKKGIPHNVLNAKQHEREAIVVAQAGRKQAVTISTNMAGRGTDIILGGNAEMLARNDVDPENAAKIGHQIPESLQEKYQAALAKWRQTCDQERLEVLEAGGLHILGTERHESRRIDNQLRGRSGRQGDIGSSRFYLSLEDDLMRIFGAERIKSIMEWLKMEEDVPIEHPMINRSIEKAQKQVEGHNFDIRKSLLEYDDVMNQQRKTIYALRRQVLEGRYEPVLTEAELKAGKQVVTADTLHEDTVKSWAYDVRPLLARLLEQAKQKGQEIAAGQRAEEPAAPLPSADDWGQKLFRSWIYDLFGFLPEVPGLFASHPTTAEGPAAGDAQPASGEAASEQAHAASRTTTLDHLATEVARRMVQQRERILDLSDASLSELIDETCPEGAHAEDWDLDALRAGMKERFGFEPGISTKGLLERDGLAKAIWEELEKVVEARELGANDRIGFLKSARYFMLSEIDQRWIEHLRNMEALREGIHLRGYGQKDPKQEYKKEGFAIFGEMMANITRNVCHNLFKEKPQQTAPEEAAQHAPETKQRARRIIESGGGSSAAAAPEEPHPVRRAEPKIGRNDPCYCGSGKKYKRCHGA
jgi:preprotein translocase subunit SecA